MTHQEILKSGSKTSHRSVKYSKFHFSGILGWKKDWLKNNFMEFLTAESDFFVNSEI